ncbi:endonuclease III [Blochmannia endosymbiont of Polyrhachis (Hedomyrma) turneri]|uniref:endonuclease III n=1 Tax=Blochmannia endosymbiont of Polyrhachis (Hedomyrma) turneri TaxID=1505596 RepID=UPI00061A8980|nr:endonuclease III [Blochmannia endosymbiont of Polyrhachis (Hedomyrma) turneri]AKC59938.1 endonuclease III [Blochmannia endosymbiont of Polyrhachis (Hedomyrma) turneri]
MNKKIRYKILYRFYISNPKPVIELDYRSSFELLIAVLLSAQSTDRQVNQVTKKLFMIADTPGKMVALGISGIKTYIKSVGLFNNKAKNIFYTCRLLMDRYHGLVPENRILLEELPGIGRKSANVILNEIFSWPVIAVDRHVFRFCNRTRFAVGKNVYAVEKKLSKVVPNKFKVQCHRWFVLHARYICMAKTPLCDICFINDMCDFYKNFSIK